MKTNMDANMDTNTNMVPDEDMATNMKVPYCMPSTSRKWPREIEHLLPLRSAMRQYKLNGGRITTSDESPESDGEGLSDGKMFSMCLYPPIVGHAVTANGNLCVCESSYAELQPYEMHSMVANTNLGGLKWILPTSQGFARPVPVEHLNSNMMLKAAMVYEKNGPMCAYNNQAVSEAMNHSMSSSFWQSMYGLLEDIACDYGPYGLFHGNTVVSLGDVAGNDLEPDLEQRQPKPDQCGFLDSCFTPPSKASGKVRALSNGCSIRIMTKRTIQIACEMLGLLRFASGIGNRDWIVRCMGFCCLVTEKDVRMIVAKWKEFNEINMPTLHVFRGMKVLTISVSTGTIIRPMRTTVDPRTLEFRFQGPYVDNMSVYHSDTMQFANLSFPKPETEPEQFFNIAILTIPFVAWTADPRPNLGMQMLRQALCTYPVSGDATVVSHGETPLLVKTDYMAAIQKYAKALDGSKIISVPGTHVVTAFVNRYMNMEDGCSVCKEWAESGALSWSGYINYPLPSDAGPLKIGMNVINKHWWKPAINGIILELKWSKVGDSYAIVYVWSDRLRVGDKLGVSHGLKFTVAELIPLADMPRLKNEETGEVVVPNLLLSTKNITRGLGGVIREMTANTSLFKSIEEFRTMSGPKPSMMYTFEDQKKCKAKLPIGTMMMNNEPLTFNDEKVGQRTVKASYGILRILQLRHISALKQHYPSVDFKTLTVPRGRYRQGTPRVSEGELVSMLMQNLPSCARDAISSDDMVEIDWCGSCERFSIGCDCPRPKPEPTKVQGRYSSVLLNVFSDVAMLNTWNGDFMGMRFKTSS